MAAVAPASKHRFSQNKPRMGQKQPKGATQLRPLPFLQDVSNYSFTFYGVSRPTKAL